MTGWGAASKGRHAAGSSSTGLFLALYLLLLAFFILLNSVSRIEEVKSKAVIDSIATTFSGGNFRSALPPIVGVGDVLALEEAQQNIGKVMRSLVPAVRVNVKVPGWVMEAVIPADALFVPNETIVRPDAVSFLDRLIAALSTLPAGYAADLQVTMPVPVAANEPLPVQETMASGRLGALVRGLLARGMPASALAAGLERGAAHEVRMVVRLTAEAAAPPVDTEGGG